MAFITCSCSQLWAPGCIIFFEICIPFLLVSFLLPRQLEECLRLCICFRFEIETHLFRDFYPKKHLKQAGLHLSRNCLTTRNRVSTVDFHSQGVQVKQPKSQSLVQLWQTLLRRQISLFCLCGSVKGTWGLRSCVCWFSRVAFGVLDSCSSTSFQWHLQLRSSCG